MESAHVDLAGARALATDTGRWWRSGDTVVSVAACAIGALVGVAAEWPRWTAQASGEWIADLVTGWTLVAAGVVAWRQARRSAVGPLLVASGLAWFLDNLDASRWTQLQWIADHGVSVYRGPLLQALVCYPTGRPASRPERVATAFAYATAFLPFVWRDQAPTVVLSTLLVAFTAWRFANAIARERRSRRTAMRLAALLGAVLIVDAATRASFPGLTTEHLRLLAYETVLCVVAVGLARGLLPRPWDQRDVTDLVVDLGTQRPGSLRDALSRALGDPGLEVGYWAPAHGQFIDADGRQVAAGAAGPDRVATVIDAGREPVAVLLHDRALLDDPALASAVGAATRLAAVNARLQAEVRAQLDEIEASRRRLVTAGDDEHRRLERRLRSGAEQRLEALAADLDTARLSVDGPAGDVLADLDARLTSTLEEVRALAAGLHPRLLTEVSLPGALEALAARCPTPAQVVAGDGQLPEPINAAIYFVCSEALANVAKHASATSAVITLEIRADDVRVEIRDDGSGGADTGPGIGMRNLADRVEALGGRLRVVSRSGAGTRVVAELPLGDDPA